MSKVLIIGGGGREHAIASTLASSKEVQFIAVSPGNAGTHNLPKVKNVSLNIRNHKEVIDYCFDCGVSLVVVGPEAPIADGLVDSLEEAKIKVFGPTKDAARIETSKAWAKDFMSRHSIPTAEYEIFHNYEDAKIFIDNCSWDGFAVKASGLAGGKGVVVVDDKEDAKRALETFNATLTEASRTIVIEEKLSGFEVSVLAFSDGTDIHVMPPAQDHKPRFAGGVGPNTGGMGAYCPCHLVSRKDLQFIEKFVLQKTVDEMKKEGYPYVGVLYAGIMITKDGPKVLEFNCRFGDPECQALMPLLKYDVFSIMQATVDGKLKTFPTSYDNELFSVAISVVIENYPNSVQKGLNLEIRGIDNVAKDPNTSIIIAGAKFDEGSRVYKTSGGRVLNVCSTGKSLPEALSHALVGASKITFENAPQGYKADYRGDIGIQAIKSIYENRICKLSYSNVGVHVTEGNQFVKDIKKYCDQTKRPGVKSELGMFGSVFDTKLEGYNNPLLISGTDGVGTKLKVACETGINDTVGQDLVAMCVNDILVHAAEPLFFLDYLASGKLDLNTHADIVKGIAKGCLLAKCSLVGGETAEMPGLYNGNDYDIAGFVVGAVEEHHLLPKMSEMKPGDILIGVASSGLHSNGFSMIRRILNTMDLDIKDSAPFNPKGILYKEILKPTYIYTPLLELLRSGLILGAAHVTGGGIAENLTRIIPSHLGVKVKASWKIPSVFGWLAGLGVRTEEMLGTFNLGIGLVLVAREEQKEKILQIIHKSFFEKLSPDEKTTYPVPKGGDEDNASAWVVGSVVEGKEKNDFDIAGLNGNLTRCAAMLMDNFPRSISLVERKRVAVLISGTGTNLQALLDHTLSGPSKAEIALVISNVEGVKGLERAAKVDVPSVVISHKNYSNRVSFEKELTEVLLANNIDIICLAGFMRILTGSFVQKWQGRLINIHPSLLPSFRGKDAQMQALEAGVCITGCTVHFVAEEVDAGAIITQEHVLIHPDDDVETLSERIKQAEHIAFPRALEMIARRKISLDQNGQLQRH